MAYLSINFFVSFSSDTVNLCSLYFCHECVVFSQVIDNLCYFFLSIYVFVYYYYYIILILVFLFVYSLLIILMLPWIKIIENAAISESDIVTPAPHYALPRTRASFRCTRRTSFNARSVCVGIWHCVSTVSRAGGRTEGRQSSWTRPVGQVSWRTAVVRSTLRRQPWRQTWTHHGPHT